MINFRYHVVSIIGIFMALAVGVVLGAGPLQRTINTGMNRSSSAAASDPQLSAQAEAEAAGLKALASSSLTGTQVALVVLPGASDDDVAAVRSTLTDAGASVVGRVTLTDNWQSTSMSQYRATLSTSLASHLESAAAKTASADGVVGYSIVQVLTSSGSETDLLRQILTDKSTPLMTIDEDPAGKATTLVAIGARAQSSATASSAPTSPDAWVGMAQAVGSTSGVVVGDASSRDAMISRIRSAGTAVTTVDSVGTTLATVDTALALSTKATGARAYGVGSGAQSVIPSNK